MILPVGVSLSPKACLDEIWVETCGLVTLLGWASPEERDVLRNLAIRADGEALTAQRIFTRTRPDLQPIYPEADAFWGTGLEFQLPPGEYSVLEVLWSPDRVDDPVFRTDGLNLHCSRPDYSVLRDSDRVLHRSQIYGSGLPADYANLDLKLMAESLSGSILDFGCGRGVLVKLLREHGQQAEGIEIDRPEIRDNLSADVAPFIRLYDGAFPIPYDDRAFDWVICSEVLEHVSDYARAIAEIARVSRQGVLITVPDMSAVPTLHKHNVVPWHLLESTHVNFFTQNSLFRALQPHFGAIDFFRIGASQTNQSLHWVSLAAFARH